MAKSEKIGSEAGVVYNNVSCQFCVRKTAHSSLVGLIDVRNLYFIFIFSLSEQTEREMWNKSGNASST